MNILVIGLGSMGKRRIRLIREMYPEFAVYGVNRGAKKRKEAEEQFGIRCFAAISEVNISIDVAFICTAPLTHAELITDCLSSGWHVFTELNLVPDGYERNIALAEKQGLVLFLSSTFLYREETRFICNYINGSPKWNYIYHIGQYLPDWHPWENYKNMFLSDKRTNGCREILSIELPWLIQAFGSIIGLRAVSDQITELAIDYHDNYMIQINHKNGNKGILVVDVVSPCAVRKMEAYTECKYISWDGTPETLEEYNIETGTLRSVVLTEETEHKEGYKAFIVENAYKNEIREFFDIVEGKKKAEYGFRQDFEVLKIIESVGA